jgi:hypothetical protein
MTKPSSFTSVCICLVLIPGAIALAGTGLGQSSSRTQPPAWSIYIDPARQPATGPAVSGDSRPDAPTTRIAQTAQEWKWGELLVGRTYRGAMTLSNQCTSDVRVGLFAYGLPDLLIPPTATIPAGRSIGVPYRIRPSAAATADAIRGEVVVWLPPGTDATCPPFRLVHTVSGRARPATPQDEAVEKAMVARQRTADACMQWWLFGEAPAGRTEAECAPLVRRAAIRARQLLASESPALKPALSRMPTDEAIGAMSMTDLRALRRDFAAAIETSK